jgi:hypothetical protein
LLLIFLVTFFTHKSITASDPPNAHQAVIPTHATVRSVSSLSAYRIYECIVELNLVTVSTHVKMTLTSRAIQCRRDLSVSLVWVIKCKLSWLAMKITDGDGSPLNTQHRGGGASGGWICHYLCNLRKGSAQRTLCTTPTQITVWVSVSAFSSLYVEYSISCTEYLLFLLQYRGEPRF